jgi:hypothetical protein
MSIKLLAVWLIVMSAAFLVQTWRLRHLTRERGFVRKSLDAVIAETNGVVPRLDDPCEQLGAIDAYMVTLQDKVRRPVTLEFVGFGDIDGVYGEEPR